VMRKPENASKNGAYTEGSLFSPTITPVVQRACAHCDQEKEQTTQRKETGATTGGFTAPPSVSRAISRSGQGLDSNAKTFMESRFNRSFDNVQVHTDSDSAASARDISARAYTSGNHIVFGDGQYQPNTEGGRHLLAHELTHVVQQSGRQDKVQRDATTAEWFLRGAAVLAADDVTGVGVADDWLIPVLIAGAGIAYLLSDSPTTVTPPTTIAPPTALPIPVPTSTTPPPKTESDTKTKTIDPIPVPIDRDKTKEKPNCMKAFPNFKQCTSLPERYGFKSQQAALAYLKKQTGISDLSLRSPAASQSGPCPGQGEHFNVRSSGDKNKYTGSIVCCPCCQETPNGPVAGKKCGIV
jgi:hypothetical protein